MGYALTARMLAADPLTVSPITAEVRLPNRDWLRFLDGDLTAQDWELIGRVERGEISVDAAVAEVRSDA